MADFTIIGEIADVETFAAGRGIRDLRRLNRLWGRGKWRKRKGRATIKTSDGETWRVELHWYEAHGIGKRNFKVKRWIEQL
ncbi:MAG TPA: hypothetical protein VMT94_06225 [Burkholderiales bacterium]|nr:hypothetical protein [Burkholderiales bacterium]